MIGLQDFNITVYRYMNGELHSIYRHFNKTINVLNCTPYRNSSDSEYPFNKSVYYNHTSCKDDGTYQGIDNVCYSNNFIDRMLFTNESFNDFIKAGINLYSEYMRLGVYYYIGGDYYNISKLNDGYRYELQVNSSGDIGNVCNGSKWYNVTSQIECPSPTQPSDGNYTIFGSCQAYNSSLGICENLDQPYEKRFLDFPRMKDSLEKEYKDIYFSHNTYFNITTIEELLSIGNCSYVFEGDCRGHSCGCGLSGECNVAEKYYRDADNDGAVDLSDPRCQCNETSEYKRFDGGNADCYDVNNDKGPFFKKDSDNPWCSSDQHGNCQGTEEFLECDPFPKAQERGFDFISKQKGTEIIICKIYKNDYYTNITNFMFEDRCIS